MLRNYEFRRYLWLQLLISAIALVVAALWLGWAAAGLVLTALIITYINFYLFTRWRYRELEELSRYLRQIASGEYSFVIRDNREGELSILKNEIFKVTVRLSEQSEYLLRDKERMSEAISDISHQLKTPLTSMGVMLDLLKQPNLPHDKQKEFLKYMQQQLERLEWLITSLLKLSKLEAGTVLFQSERVKLAELVQRALSPIEIPIEIKNINIVLEGDTDLTLDVDKKWTIEAILNVVKNAVEHTPHGGTITLTLSRNELYTALIVADTGSGIAKEDIPHLFKRFYRGKQASESSVGIGLAMSYHILQAQKGVIEVHNGLQLGAVFTLKWYH
ncbi:sensor histidine kinase [Paenibacillus camelliae]|uniref:sensor histidine kinase n=1 Tax=Paenibacillus camelliae TaxID=512410 RepID=UPI00203BC2BC|nr:HAMP domain-containing sensor histidine kinase [Paenibacillus camelliae]MCM3634056.1 HAMP domain-containing histidine kinase [Paenibacillus camelliae]